MSVGTGVSKSSFQWMNVANETHTALGRTLEVQIRCQAFRTQDKPLDTVDLVLKTERQRQEMATTHIWFLNPCWGHADPAVQAASLAWAAS